MRQKDYEAISARTAMARTTASAPARWLVEHGKIWGRTLDYGCGRGKDAETYLWEKFDPCYFPVRPDGLFKTIVCTYVLNTIPPLYELKILRDIRSLLDDNGGNAYISVRRDIQKDGLTNSGTYQRTVYLPYEVLHKTRGYIIYRVQAK
jgi:hypothetical protein